MITAVPMYHTTTENAVQAYTGALVEIIDHPYGTGIYIDGKVEGWVTSTLNDKWLAGEVSVKTKDKKVFDSYIDAVEYLIQQIQEGV